MEGGFVSGWKILEHRGLYAVLICANIVLTMRYLFSQESFKRFTRYALSKTSRQWRSKPLRGQIKKGQPSEPVSLGLEWQGNVLKMV